MLESIDIQQLLIYVGGAILAGSATIAYVATTVARSANRRSPRRAEAGDELPTIDF